MKVETDEISWLDDEPGAGVNRMGFMETMQSLLSGAGRSTIPVTLEPEEREIFRVVASHRPGSATSVGGDLVLTDRRLVFTPLDTRGVVDALTWSLSKAGAPDIVNGAPQRIGELIAQADVGAVMSVAAGSEGSLFRPPTLVVTGTDSVPREFGVLAHRRARNSDPRNVRFRDDMLARIETSILRRS